MITQLSNDFLQMYVENGRNKNHYHSQIVHKMDLKEIYKSLDKKTKLLLLWIQLNGYAPVKFNSKSKLNVEISKNKWLEKQLVYLDYNNKECRGEVCSNKGNFYSSIKTLCDNKILYKTGYDFTYILNPYYIDNMSKSDWEQASLSRSEFVINNMTMKFDKPQSPE